MRPKVSVSLIKKQFLINRKNFMQVSAFEWYIPWRVEVYVSNVMTCCVCISYYLPSAHLEWIYFYKDKLTESMGLDILL